MNSYDKGTHTLSTVFEVGDVATDPTTVTFTLKGNGETVTYVYGTDAELEKDSTGNYHVDYNFEDSGYFLYSFTGTGDCEAVDSDYIIIGSTADLITLTRIELEDVDEAIFTDATINHGIEKALAFASRYVPYENKITVDLTASSKDVDISGIKGLIKVLKAEFEVDQDPKEFRNITKFGNTITIQTDLTPETGDTAYLYCHQIHSADTLGVDLLNIIPRLAAAYVAINNVGDGRTEIQSAIAAAALINSSTDSMTARLTQVATDIGSMRTNTTSLLSSITTTTTNIETALTTAISQIEDAGTANASIDISSELTDADTEITATLADIDDVRDALTMAYTEASDELTSISEEITLGIADLATARALNNKVPQGISPESQLHASANAEFNAAMARISDIQNQLKTTTGAGELGNLAGNQINAIQSLLTKARAIISSYANQTSGYTTIAAREISVANAYIAEARTLLYKFMDAINAYASAARLELSSANTYLSQAGGYAREITGRLNVANIISGYTKWGQNIYNLTIQELRRLQKPQVYYTYPRS